MGFEEPRSRKLRKAASTVPVIFLTLISSAHASPSHSKGYFSHFFKEVDAITETKNFISSLFTTGPQQALDRLVDKAQKAVQSDLGQHSLIEDNSIQYKPESAVGDRIATTIKFTQTFKGIEIVGNETRVHFDRTGEIDGVTSGALNALLETEPTLSEQQATQILTERYQQNVELSEAPVLKVLKDFDGKTHLVYYLLTRTSQTHNGKEVYLDAHSGQVVFEIGRAYELNEKITVYSGDTDEAKKYVDARGYPTRINVSWYEKVIEDRKKNAKADRSAINAYQNTARVYHYYSTRFERKSFDDRDSRIVNVVHMGNKMANAFWTNEYKIMGYGDGDGEHLIDLTNGLDVAAHELTHGVTASSAKLVYAGEPGALNESYSDFFGKMVDYNQGNWDIGAKIVAPAWKRRALRNMNNPEEFRQPGTNDSPLKTPTTGSCTQENDHCGVHRNSGIPNRAAALIVDGIGKEKAEQLYYHVLTQRLGAMSSFKDAREQTETACKKFVEQKRFGDSELGFTDADCKIVTQAFDTVKM